MSAKLPPNEVENKPAEWKAPEKIESMYDSAPTLTGNSPEAGARTEELMPKGDKPYQLYSLATPNGQKIGIMLHELGVEFDAYTINIMKGDQFKSGFVAVNPNSKIPALLDQSTTPPTRLFESGSMLLYLADKHKKLIPEAPAARAEVINWLMWQMGSAPYFGQFGHYFKYCAKTNVDAIEYGVKRYGMESQRLLSVLDKQLEGKQNVCGEYSIADVAIFPWVNTFYSKTGYGASDFLSVEKYKNVTAWVARMNERDAVKKGVKVTGFN